MNPFIKSNKPWLSLLGLAVIVVFLAFLFRPKSPEYQIGADQTAKLMNDPQMQVAFSDLAGKQLIDIRPSELFAQGHPELAVNIPARNLLDKESVELFDRLLKSGQEAIVYGSDELQAVAPWLLLQQLGYSNVKVLKGGFVGHEFRESAQSSAEVMLLDTAAMKVKPASTQATEKTEQKKPQTVTPVRKAASSGGGC